MTEEFQSVVKKGKNTELFEFVNTMTKGIEGLVVASDDSLTFGRIPFNIPPLDKLTGGGIPRKRLSIVTGPTNSGKSYLASQAVRTVQENGGVAAWIDAEMTLDAKWMKKCGVNVDELLVLQTGNGDKAFAASRDLLQAPVDLVVIDSIAGLVPELILNDDDKTPMAWQARFVNRCLPIWLDDLQHGSSLLAINQMTSSLGPVYLDNMPGGQRQNYMSHLILNVRRQGWLQEKGDKVGFDMKITMKKTKVGGEHYDEVIVPFKMDGGIDIVEIVIREAIERKIIKKSAAWYKIGDASVQGMNGIKEYYAEHPEEFEALKEEVNE